MRPVRTDSPTNTLSCSAAPSTVAASCWSLTTAASRTFSLRRRVEGVGDVGQIATSSGPDSSAARAVRDCCSDSAVRADNNSTCGPALDVGRRDRRRLLEDDMRVGAAHTERADPGAPNAVPLPRAVLAAHDEGPSVKMQFRVGAGVKCRVAGIARCLRQRIVLIKPAIPAADSRWPMLDLTEPTKHGPALVRRRNTECLSQAFDLDRVAERRAGSMGLDIAHGRRVDVGDRHAPRR